MAVKMSVLTVNWPTMHNLKCTSWNLFWNLDEIFANGCKHYKSNQPAYELSVRKGKEKKSIRSCSRALPKAYIFNKHFTLNLTQGIYSPFSTTILKHSTCYENITITDLLFWLRKMEPFPHVPTLRIFRYKCTSFFFQIH